MNYTTQAQEVLKLAAESAKLMQHPYIGTEHLLIGLSKDLFRRGRPRCWI